MKKYFSILLAATLFISIAACAQGDKSKRPSPPATLVENIDGGAKVTIEYSQPSVKGRTIGKDLEPKPGMVWRTGANEATTFETTKDVQIEGQRLPAGKYALFTLVDGDKWTFIFNKVAQQWGAFKYNDKEDALRVTTTAVKAPKFCEQMTFTISKIGEVKLMWGDVEAHFTAK